MDVSSVMEAWRWSREWSGCGLGLGMSRIREVRRGRRASIVSGSRGAERGERKGWQRVWRVRVWFVRWVVRAVWAVMRRLVPFSTAACEERSFRWEETRAMISSWEVLFASVPRRARDSIADMRASREGEMPDMVSGSESLSLSEPSY